MCSSGGVTERPIRSGFSVREILTKALANVNYVRDIYQVIDVLINQKDLENQENWISNPTLEDYCLFSHLACTLHR